ncbi:hypothetical protein KIPB_011473, partial [Kipferlia bialata]|eukprot:g11473.t1
MKRSPGPQSLPRPSKDPPLRHPNGRKPGKQAGIRSLAQLPALPRVGSQPAEGGTGGETEVALNDISTGSEGVSVHHLQMPPESDVHSLKHQESLSALDKGIPMKAPPVMRLPRLPSSHPIHTLASVHKANMGGANHTMGHGLGHHGSGPAQSWAALPPAHVLDYQSASLPRKRLNRASTQITLEPVQ